MANIFSLFGEILIDNQKANKSIDETAEKAEKSGSRIGSAFSAIGKGATAIGTAVVAGTSAFGASAYKIASDTAEQADEVDKMSQKLGMSRQAYQEWDYVLSQSGVEITSMSTGLKTLTNKIDDAKNGSASALGMFDKLGISLEDLNNMSREDAFDAVIKSMQGMEDSTERAALANDLFGKSGQELTALFNQTAESTDELKNKAHELGMVMSDETVTSGVDFVDTIDTVKRSVGGLMNNLGATVMPIVQKVLNLIIEKLPAARELLNKFFPVIENLFGSIMPPLFSLIETLFPALMDIMSSLMPSFESIISSVLPVIVQLIEQLAPFLTQIIQDVLPILAELLESLMPLFTKVIESVLPLIVELLEKILPPIIQIVESLLPVLTTLIDTLTPVIEPLLDALKSIIEAILPPLIEKIQFFTEKIMPPLREIFKSVAEAVSTRFKNAFEGIKKVFDNVKGVFNGITDFVKNVFTGNWRGAWEAVVKIFSNIFDGIKNAFKVPINWIIDGINGFIRGINKVQIPDWVPVVGGKGFNISELKRLKVGMEYVPYDDMPALLHKGERVLTASENKDYGEYEKLKDSDASGRSVIIKIELGEKSIYINRLDGRSESDIDSFVNMIIELIYEKIKRKGAAFA